MSESFVDMLFMVYFIRQKQAIGGARNALYTNPIILLDLCEYGLTPFIFAFVYEYMFSYQTEFSSFIVLPVASTHTMDNFIFALVFSLSGDTIIFSE